MKILKCIELRNIAGKYLERKNILNEFSLEIQEFILGRQRIYLEWIFIQKGFFEKYHESILFHGNHWVIWQKLH